MASPAAVSRHDQEDRSGAEAGDEQAGAGGQEQGGRAPGSAWRRAVAGLPAGRPRRSEGGQGQHDEEPDEREQAEEHPAPTPLVVDEAGGGRRDEARHHPARRQQGEQLRLALGWEAATDARRRRWRPGHRRRRPGGPARAMSTGIDGASPATSRPALNPTTPSRNETTGPRRSACSADTTMLTRLASMKAANAAP